MTGNLHMYVFHVYNMSVCGLSETAGAQMEI